MSNSIHFSAIRFGENVLYDTNLTSLSTPTVILRNKIGINTAQTEDNYILIIEGDTKIAGFVSASNWVYGGSNLENIAVNQLDLQRKGTTSFLKTPTFQFNAQGNLGVGGTPSHPVTIYGTTISSNIQFIDQTLIYNSNIYSKSSYNTFYVASRTSNFSLSFPGNQTIFNQHPQVYYNGFHLSYSNLSSNDYSYATAYDPGSNQTTLTITLNVPAEQATIVDIHAAPVYQVNDGIAWFGQRVKHGFWNSNQAVYSYSNIGIGTIPTTALQTNQMYTTHLIAYEFTTQDLAQDILTASNIINTCNIAVTNQFTIPQSNLTLTGNLLTPAISFSNATTLPGPFFLPTLSALNIATNPTHFPASYIAANLGIGTTSPQQALHIEGSLSTTQLLKNNLPYSIPSNWTSNNASPPRIYYPITVSINTPPLSKSTPSLHIQGNAAFSNLSPFPTALQATTTLASPTFTGMISYFAGNTPQPGWLECNGAYQSSNLYPALFSILQTTYGPLSNEFFRLPDLRGEFVRSYSNITPVGTLQAAALQSHSHTWNFSTQTININNTLTSNTFALSPGTTSNAIGNPLHATTATETRPRNVALLPCILSI